jgi:hypothetical protein
MRRFAWIVILLTAAPAAAEPFAPMRMKEFGSSRVRSPNSNGNVFVSPDSNRVMALSDSGIGVQECATGRS